MVISWSKLTLWSCCWLTKVSNGHLKFILVIWSHFLIKIGHFWLTTVISWLSKVISINIYRSESLPFRYIYTSLIACTLRLGLPLCHPHQCLWRISTSWYLIFCYYIKKKYCCEIPGPRVSVLYVLLFSLLTVEHSFYVLHTWKLLKHTSLLRPTITYFILVHKKLKHTCLPFLNKFFYTKQNYFQCLKSPWYYYMMVFIFNYNDYNAWDMTWFQNTDIAFPCNIFLTKRLHVL